MDRSSTFMSSRQRPYPRRGAPLRCRDGHEGALGHTFCHLIMAEKLHSMRVLEQHKVDYTVRAFPDTIHSADGVADYFGLSREMVYKTLVVQPAQGKPILVLVAGCRELDLKKVARALGQKKVQMATHKDAERWTGLQTGGISPLALLHKHFPVYIDRPALALPRLLVSAGKRGVNLELAVADLFKITKATAMAAT